MSEPTIPLDWQWRPTWTLAPNPADPGGPWIPTWTGWEYLFDGQGRQVMEKMDGSGWGVGGGAAVSREAPPPDCPVPTREEIAANRARKGLPPLPGDAA